MKKVFLLLLFALVVVLMIASACAQAPEEPPPPEEGIRIEVSRQGFNGTPGEFRLAVEEGQEVEITFVYGDNDFPENNPHIIAIPDYGINTSVLDENNPEVTVRFTAKEIGEVAFLCTKVDCVGHTNLLGGILVIE